MRPIPSKRKASASSKRSAIGRPIPWAKRSSASAWCTPAAIWTAARICSSPPARWKPACALLLRCRRVSADVTMVQSGLRRDLLARLGIETWCGVHDPESYMLAQAEGITRSAAGIRRAWQRWGNDQIVAIGDAPTAVMEAVRLIRE
ncbi:precorrin-8X methylmutase, partial [Methylogaea oryzae]|uniref:precorrin-8X methylmutase n=1 Tax=Methylogaea oryzae TaxID=1295382 RepID=UPI001C3F4B0D